MKNNSSKFLDPSETDRFNQKGFLVDRTLVETSVSINSNQNSDSIKLNIIIERLSGFVKREKKWFECRCITVHDNDGMTWSAEKARTVAEKVCPDHFNIWCLGNKIQVDSLPLISRLLEKNEFLRLASKKNLTNKFITLKSWTSFAIIGFALLTGFIFEFLQIYLKSSSQPSQFNPGAPFNDLYFYIVLLLVVTFGFISKHLLTQFTTRTKSKSIEVFIDELSKKIDSIAYKEFVDLLAQSLSKVKFPRVIIIDNYEALDLTTKMVFKRYLEKYCENALGSEFWIVFEKNSGDRFSANLFSGLSTFAFNHTKMFDQKFLTQSEKEKLCEIIGRPESAAKNTTIKAICRDNTEGKELILKRLEQHRILHPHKEAEYDSLTFLYFLSLVSLPEEIFLSPRYLTKGLSVKSGLRSQILRLFLKNTSLRKDEFEKKFSEINEHFKEFFTFDDEKDLVRIRVKPEFAEVIKENRDLYKLPNAGFGHLFWSLFWHDKLRNHPKEAIWIRKLSFHILESDLSDIKDEKTFTDVSLQLLESILFTLDSCTKVCLFDKINPLLDKISSLFEFENISENLRKQILSRCWESYLLLGDEKILSYILEIYSTISENKDVSDQTWENPLDKLFFDSIPILPSLRKSISPAFLIQAIGSAENGETLTNYAHSRAIWLASAIEPSLLNQLPDEFYNEYITGKDQLEDLMNTTINRIRNTNYSNFRFIDYMTLSILNWSVALQCNNNFNETDNKLLERLYNQIYKKDSSKFDLLLQFSKDVVSLAVSIDKSESVKNAFDNLLDEAFLKELCGISLAALIIAFSDKNIPNSDEVDETIIKKIADIVSITNTAFNYSLPAINSIKDLMTVEFIKKTVALLEFSGIIWKRFGLTRQLSFNRIRQCQFWSLTKTKQDLFNSNAHNDVLKILGDSINITDFSGILSNIVAANSLNNSAEYSAHYLSEAGKISINFDFAESFRDNLSFLIIQKHHTIRKNLEPFLKEIMENLENRKDSALKEAMRLRKDEGLISIFNALLNASRKQKSDHLRKKVYTQLFNSLEHVSSDPLRNELTVLIEMSELEDNIQRGEKIDVKNLLPKWESRKELWIYPSFLSIVLNYGDVEELQIQETISLLDHDPNQDHWNTYVFLSLDVCKYLLKNQRLNDTLIPKKYLSKAIVYWESSFNADINFEIYKILYELYPEKKESISLKILEWQEIIIQRDHLNLIPDLILKGSNFLVFQYYYEEMRFWGLKLNIERKDFNDRININSNDMMRIISEWKLQGSVIPDPIINNSNIPVLNSEFLIIGSFLYNKQLDKITDFEYERTIFNNAALHALPKLIEAICFLPNIPISINQILKKYLNRFIEFTMPE